MTTDTPLILVVADRKPVSSGAWVDVLTDGLPTTYLRAVERAGGCPILLPPSSVHTAMVERLLEFADGFLLAGGRDIAAASYGQESHPLNDPPVVERDRLEAALTRSCYNSGIPILGACRGMQLINTAFGGTLEQHVGDRLDMTPHRDRVGTFTQHSVEVLPDTRLQTILGSGPFDIASHHHQAVDRLGAGLRPSAVAPDGLIEALESIDARYVVGVQWHPEERMDPEGAQLLTSFIGAAREYHQQKRSPAEGLHHV
ncbi:gamma-glutamyl-gamma-aminobutyrate hydrolase family protein [Rhodococcus sp. NPDC057529]|uniref:gamma-glutamyl-gamma-aminobutyrate hydrolase family protein n=1 Tax=Rhodococcus sp. NPDC057529 TaxID=3346158 RepID=UPI00366F54B0